MNPYVRGYRLAAKHLLALGLTPMPCRHELQTLWTAGSNDDRALVLSISQRWETEA